MAKNSLKYNDDWIKSKKEENEFAERPKNDKDSGGRKKREQENEKNEKAVEGKYIMY